MKKKTKAEYILETINKIERVAITLEQRTKFDLFPINGLVDDVRKYKEVIDKRYGGR